VPAPGVREVEDQNGKLHAETRKITRKNNSNNFFFNRYPRIFLYRGRRITVIDEYYPIYSNNDGIELSCSTLQFGGVERKKCQNG